MALGMWFSQSSRSGPDWNLNNSWIDHQEILSEHSCSSEDELSRRRRTSLVLPTRCYLEVDVCCFESNISTTFHTRLLIWCRSSCSPLEGLICLILYAFTNMLTWDNSLVCEGQIGGYGGFPIRVTAASQPYFMRLHFTAAQPPA